MAEAGGTPGGACRDLADQLVNWGYGDGFEIALGGGRANFLPDSVADPEDEGETGGRADGRNLAEEWTSKSNNHVVVHDKRGLAQVDLDSGARVLGLFDSSHMEYEVDRMRDLGGEPSLAEMTESAIDRLEQSEDGYVLLVEAGRVDHGHHDGNAARALEDMVAFDAAIRKALEMTDREDTLIVVTADHSHTLTINGYPKRGNPLLGVVIDVENQVALGLDGRPYTTLGYANGPGGVFPPLPEPVVEETVAEADATLPEAGGSPASPPATVTEETAAPTAPEAATTEVVQPEAPAAASPAAAAPAAAPAAPAAVEAEPITRPDLTDVNTEHVDFLQQSLVPLESETHGGDDVAVFAWGPSAHAFHGVVEQNLIYHVMAHAIGLPRNSGSPTSGEAAPAQ
jgi:alkaline phosphatase